WQENASDLWWGKTSPTAAWGPAAGTSTSPLPAATTPTPTPTPTPTATGTAGTRDASQIPFASDSIFNLPLGTGATWASNAQLAGAGVYINTPLSGYNENIYTGTASDPLVTITDNGSVDGKPETFQVHIPAGAVAAAGGDATFSVDDTTTHTWYSFGGFNWTGSTTATVNQGSGESDYGSGLQVANSNWDEGVGTLRESDLQAGSIDHMLRMEAPTTMLMSYTSSAYQLAPYAWPQTQEDGFAVNGNGGPAYSGTIPYGVTIGIPDNAVEPAAVAANAGANMLWHALQNHGAMIRDSGGSGNNVIFQSDQNVNGSDPLILSMEQYGAQIMAQAKILTNQGPNSINGGGTPVTALDANPSDMPATATPTPTPTATPTPTPTATPTPTPTPTPAATPTATPTPSPNDTMVLAGSSGSVTDAGGNAWTITSGGQVAVNGTADMTTANVTELAYVNGNVWQENSANLWWSKTSPTAAWGPAAGTSTSPLPAPITIGAGESSATVSQSQVSVVATSGTHMLFLSGQGDIVTLTGGADTVTDSGSGNTYVLPAAGKGSVAFTNNVLTINDTLDLKPALAATTWNGSSSTLGSYLTVSDSASGATLSIANAAGGTGTVIATIGGATNASLQTVLAHAIT
ncbi:MAG TPA: hypothetical protein VFG62_23905, partial [Rhodopila sp.]|nr:hypothetical protein [Rhodopila sp.]